MTTNIINVEYDDYLKLLASHIVLNVYKRISSITTSKDKHFLNLKKKNVKKEKLGIAWDIDLNHASNINRNGKNDLCFNFKLKKYINIERWYCISRPQYKYSCGISSLVSCWNYLFSKLGHGKLPVLTHEYALRVLGFHEPFSEIRFGPFTGNGTLIKWFGILNNYFHVNGVASIFYKPKGKSRTIGINEHYAKETLKEYLKSNDCAFIYHCYNHYCCPIGYEIEATSPLLSYETNENDEGIEWFLIADTSRKYPSIHCFKWDDINKDLNMENPEYINIRQLEKGVLKYESKKLNNNGNLHCLILFKRID